MTTENTPQTAAPQTAATPEQALDRMLRAYEAECDNAQFHPGANLRRVIDDSPQLRASMLTLIAEGKLERIVDAPPGREGAYDAVGNTLAIPAEQLLDAHRDTQAANGIRFSLGHELQHARDRDALREQRDGLLQTVGATATGPSPHDHTAAVRDFVDTSRALEVRAEIAGFNTLADHVRAQNPAATLADLYNASPNDMRLYVDVDLQRNPPAYSPKPGLDIGPDLRLDPNDPRTVTAMGQHFFDAVGYPRGETLRALGAVVEIERQAQAADPQRPAPELRLDMTALGFPGARPPQGFVDTGLLPQAAPPTPADHRGAENLRGDDRRYFDFLRERLPAEVPDNAVAHAMRLAREDGMTDPSKVDPSQVGVAGGKVWIGGNVPGQRIGADVDAAPAMPQVLAALDEDRQRQASSVMRPQEAAQPAPAMAH